MRQMHLRAVAVESVSGTIANDMLPLPLSAVRSEGSGGEQEGEPSARLRSETESSSHQGCDRGATPHESGELLRRER